MLKTNQLDIEQKPRKRVKIDVSSLDEYNQFKGEAVQNDQFHQHINNSKSSNKIIPQKIINVEEQIKAYQQIYDKIKKNPRGYKKISQKSGKQQANISKMPTFNLPLSNAKTKMKQLQSKKSKQKRNQPSNWQKFLKAQPQTKGNSKQKIQNNKKNQYQFIAIDCQFVKSGQEDLLARVSLINQHNQQVYDSYVKPGKKITDFVTQISGITYGHIKNAPSQEEVIKEMKKKMLNKIIIGHTVDKDLSVCGLKDWTGFKKIIDIADAPMYSPGGKRLGLKKLAYNHLGRNIQDGWHSSSEDATATMQLFLKHKQQILKDNKVVKK